MTSSTPPRRRFAAGGATLALLVALVAGCGSDSGANLVSPDDKTANNTVENVSGENADGEGSKGGETSEGTDGDGGSDQGDQGEATAEELPYPGPEQFKEEIELAKTMTAQEVQEYAAQKAQELEDEFAAATAEEEEERIAAIEALNEEFSERVEAYYKEYGNAIREAGYEATPEEMTEIERRFAGQKVALNNEYEEERQAIEDRFNEQTADVRAEFAPRFLESQARMEYMTKAQEEAN